VILFKLYLYDIPKLILFIVLFLKTAYLTGMKAFNPLKILYDIEISVNVCLKEEISSFNLKDCSKSNLSECGSFFPNPILCQP
tara:strand:- start:25 stop:273 length:249 start_codon:yes stop_codon:yes gene_type:complete